MRISRSLSKHIDRKVVWKVKSPVMTVRQTSQSNAVGRKSLEEARELMHQIMTFSSRMRETSGFNLNLHYSLTSGYNTIIIIY